MMRKRDVLMFAAAGLGLGSLAASFTDGENEPAFSCDDDGDGGPVLPAGEDNYLVKVAPGETVTLRITNGADVAHSFSLTSLGADEHDAIHALDPLTLIPAFGEECFFCRCGAPPE